MPRTCKIMGCLNNVFGGDVCKYHNYTRYMKGGDLYGKSRQSKPVGALSPLKHTKVPHESKRRSEERKYYSQGCKELEQELRSENNGKIYDFFTGLEIQRQVTWHHLLGRTGDYYLDKDLLVPAENNENDGHLFYHRATVEQLMVKEWYQSFLVRLKSKSIDAWNKEQRKLQKEINLFE